MEELEVARLADEAFIDLLQGVHEGTLALQEGCYAFGRAVSEIPGRTLAFERSYTLEFLRGKAEEKQRLAACCFTFLSASGETKSYTYQNVFTNEPLPSLK